MLGILLRKLPERWKELSDVLRRNGFLKYLDTRIVFSHHEHELFPVY